MSSLLIKNGNLLTLDDADNRLHGDIYIEDDRITAVGADLEVIAEKAIDAWGMRTQAGKAMMDPTENLPPLLQESTEDSLRESIDLIHRWHGVVNGRIRYGFYPRWRLWNSTELLHAIKQEADRNPGVGIHGHAGEIEYEVEAMIEQEGIPNPVYLESIGVVGPNVQLAHCIWLDEEEYRIMAETGTHAMHCPCCNAKLGSGVAKVPERC